MHHTTIHLLQADADSCGREVIIAAHPPAQTYRGTICRHTEWIWIKAVMRQFILPGIETRRLRLLTFWGEKVAKMVAAVGKRRV